VEGSFRTRIGRRSGAALLLFLAAYFGLILAASTGASIVGQRIENNRKLESDFQKTSQFVKSFLAHRGRLPNDDEIEDWSKRHLSWARPFLVVRNGPFSAEALAAFGPPPRNGFIIAIWRGEWMEYYASWSGMTTMPFDQSAYYQFGSQAADRLISGLGLLVCFAGGFGLWKSRSRGADHL
jgi:hypothetical protein